MIQAEFRRCFASERTVPREFMPGATLADIVKSFDKPPAFKTHGAVILFDPAWERGTLGQPVGIRVEREHWHLIKPKDGKGVFVTCMPQDGGGEGTKKTIQIVGLLALLAIAHVASGGLTTLLAPTLGPVVAGAIAAAGSAAILVGGSYGLGLLNKPAAGQPALLPGGGAGATLGQAGIGQNLIGAFAQLPTTRGKFRHSPPLLAQPYTLSVDNDQWVYMIVGQCGPALIENIKVNNNAIADLPSGSYEIETREGWDDDLPLTIVDECGYQQNINQEMSTHRLEADMNTLVNPFAESYPKPHLLRSAPRTNSFRIGIEFPGGIYHATISGGPIIPFRIRMRRVGDATWIKLPEIQLQMVRRGPARQEIWLRWGGSSTQTAITNELQGQTTPWKRAYLKNPAWTADSYFGTPVAAAVDLAPNHVFKGKDKIVFHLHTNTFDIDEYDIEITRGAAVAGTTTNFQPPSYRDQFTWNGPSAGATKKTIGNQDVMGAAAYIGNVASFRDQYPILDTNLALICARFRNLQVQSLSAEFTPYIDGIATSDPGANARDILVGPLNSKPFADALVDDFSELTAHSAAKGLTVNALVGGGSVEKAFGMVLQTGDAVPKRSDTWGCVIDNDRSAEGITALWTPHQMTQRLVINKNFLDNTRAILARFNDQTRDYAANEADAPIYDDGVGATDDILAIARSYEGIVFLAKVQRRALRDLRAVRMRSLRYVWGVNLEHLNCRKGNLVGVAHDILIDTYASGRIKSITDDGGSPANLLTITLNTDVEDAPVTSTSNLFDVENVFTLGELFTLTGVQVGMQVRLKTGGIVTIPVVAVAGPTLTVDGAFPLPSGWGTPTFAEKGCIAGIGPRDRETRRLILTSITPRSDFDAMLEGIDEAPAIHVGT